jgi:predicted TIM-barrel fold metal-dependent hydrolase
MEMLLTRRTILKTLGASCSLALAPGASAFPSAAELSKFAPIWDAHSHLHLVPGETPEERITNLIRFADRMGVERLMLSQGYSAQMRPTPRQLREENDRVLRAVRLFPGRVFGSVYLSPSFLDFSLQEFDRCVREGPMVGVGELEADMRCNAPELDPIVERAVAMQAPILQHTWLKIGGNEPGESTPDDLVELARRHPRATFICAHTGGDWERGIRIIRAAKNVSAEIAGFDPASGVVEMAVRELGAERVIYGSDVGGRSFASQLAKVVGAEIPDDAKKLILGGNLRCLLAPMLQAKGIRA